MPIAQVRFLIVAAALAAGGCSTGTFIDDVGTLWGDESSAEKEAKELVLEAPRVPIQAVRSVEMGRTRDGFLISAYGTAPGLGYALPSLRARRGGLPGSDGYVEYDFVAVPPAEGFNLPPGDSQTRALRADIPVTVAQLRGAVGLRVLANAGGVQMDF